MAMVYGSPYRKLREKLWNNLGRSKCGIEDPWIAMGDFNAVTCMDEVSNSNTYVEQRSRDFNNWINDKEWIDLGYTGPKFTWKRGNDTATFKGARLDRGLCSVNWLDSFPSTKITHLPAIASDHAPIL